MNPSPEEPRYHTLQLRVPVVPRAAVAAIAGVALLGAAAWGTFSLTRHHVSKEQTAAARAEVAPLADQTLPRSRAELEQLTADIPALGRRLDAELATQASRNIDVNADLAAQSALQRRLGAVGDDLAGLDRRQEIARLAHRLPTDAPLLSDAQRDDLAALQAKRADLAKQAAALDPRIELAAQRRETLAQNEADAREAVRQAAMDHAVASQAQATGQSPAVVAAAVTSPTVISSPGATTDAQKRAMADAISAQAAATGQGTQQVADSVDTVISAQAVPAPDPTTPPAPPTADNQPPPPPVPPQTTIVVQESAPPIYYYQPYYGYPYRSYYYGPSATFYWNGGGHHDGPHGGPYHH